MNSNQAKEAGAWVFRGLVLALLASYGTGLVELPGRNRQQDEMNRQLKELNEKMGTLERQITGVSSSLALTDQMLRQSVLDRLQRAEDRLTKREDAAQQAIREYNLMQGEVIILRERVRVLETANPAAVKR